MAQQASDVVMADVNAAVKAQAHVSVSEILTAAFREPGAFMKFVDKIKTTQEPFLRELEELKISEDRQFLVLGGDQFAFCNVFSLMPTNIERSFKCVQTQFMWAHDQIATLLIMGDTVSGILLCIFECLEEQHPLYETNVETSLASIAPTSALYTHMQATVKSWAKVSVSQSSDFHCYCVLIG